MEDKLTESARTRALAAAAAANAVLELAPDGTVLDCNAGFGAITGLPPDWMIGRSLDQIFPGRNPAETAAGFARVMQGEVVHYESRRRTRDDRSVILSNTCVPILDEAGRPVRILSLVVDLGAADRQAEGMGEVLSALSRSQAMIEFAPDGVILDANRNFLEVLGYQLEEVKGRHHRMFLAPADSAQPGYAAAWADLTRGHPQQGEFRRIRKDGQPMWIAATYTPILDASGKVTRVVKFATDVTGRRRGVNALIRGIEQLAQGDLTARLDTAIAIPPEFTQVREAFNASIAQLAQLVDELRGRSGAMRAEAMAIAGGADDLARRGETQAASLEQTAAAVEQISGNIGMTSESARDADASARAAESIVRDGAGIVTRAIEAMERIETHTRHMAEFTRVIENFAFQTNLLSINAAVEAARAGDVGRGFAVVANEVRNLAQQSAKASQSIAELIGKSEAEVTTGVRLVRDAGGALGQISGAVAAMASHVAGIAHATTEQAVGVREVSEALAQLDTVNQSNLALSDSNAAAAASLSTQVQEMNQLLERFRTAAAAAVAQTSGGIRPLRLSA
ncbi:PAS domain-containing protein [Paracoccus sp. S-4012]|uniref:methyl-accepting chemotaxis protein n=1 Tax=Paracoccus sp. S-4012 TaxID=2665648 RepID=UPI0012B03642|nr:methyl-accepting chemotaxis protein [Paracoccus sp. S-4012]MRX50451.1 PAS domain-containing protein [Paracoccus sp. S-4012]